MFHPAPPLEGAFPAPGIELPAFSCGLSFGEPDAARIRAHGELDLASAPHFARTLDRAQGSASLVVVDLRGLTFMDSAGVHAIVRADSHARGTRRRLVLVRGAAQIDRLFALTGLSGQLEVIEPDAAWPPSARHRSEAA